MKAPLQEALKILEWVARVNRTISRGFIERKDLTVQNPGSDWGTIVTSADIGVSNALLKGGIVGGVEGLRSLYPASFSEELDSPERTKALDLIELDPIDGTGDFVDTYRSKRIMSPTTLVARLTRPDPQAYFQPIWSIIFEVVHEYALVSDGETVYLYGIEDGAVVEIPCRISKSLYREDDPITLGRRISYPQLTYDGPFMAYLRKNGLGVRQIAVGGAGLQALQFFRQFIDPVGPEICPSGKAFQSLEPLSAIFTTQPDWKTWDTDPMEVISRALALPPSTNIYGREFRGQVVPPNAAFETLDELWHTDGYVLTSTGNLGKRLRDLAMGFMIRNPDCDLLRMDYPYKDSILEMTKQGV